MISRLYYKNFLQDEVRELKKELQYAFNLTDLQRAHENEQYDLFTRENDQSTRYHKVFYKEFLRTQRVDELTGTPFKKDSYLRQIYEQIIRKIRLNMFDNGIVYQRVPTFRVHLPNNVSVGEFHRDTDYGHNTHAINFWVPLTYAVDTSGVYIAGPEPSYKLESINMKPGDLLVFDAMKCMHGNKPNETGKTRMSFDFRVIPKFLFTGSDQTSINTGLKFDIGEYYAELA